jgi:hypothetical protein
MGNESPTSEEQQRGIEANKKGLDFELQFQHFMRQDLRFPLISHRRLERGKNVRRPMECDLLARHVSQPWRVVAYGGLTMLVFCATVAMVSFFGSDDTNARAWMAFVDTQITSIDSRLKGLGFVIVGVIAFALTVAAVWRHQTRVWVECRNTRPKIKCKYISEVVGRRSEVRAATDEFWIASPTGFDPDAIEMANANKIFCILFKDGKGTVVNSLSSRVPGLKYAEKVEGARPENLTAAIWIGGLIVAALVVVSVASGTLIPVTSAQTWSCVCYHSETPTGPVPMTACRRSEPECDRLRSSIMSGSVRRAVPGSAETLCVSVIGEHPGDRLHGRNAWEDSEKAGAYVSHAGCLLK